MKWGSHGIRGLTLGHDDPQDAIDRLLDVECVVADDADKSTQRVIKRLQKYADGANDMFLDVQLDDEGDTEFQRAVRNECREIPRGTTISYAQLATNAGSPRAARAVGNVMRTNRVPLIVPCHRVVAANSLGGYSAPNGLQLKVSLLRLEGWQG